MMVKLITLSKGLITGLTMIAFSLFFFYGLNQPPESPLQYIIYGVFMLGIIWTILSFSKKSGASLIFKDHFSAGFSTFIMVTLLMVLFTAIFYKLNPGLLEAKIALNNQLALKEGNHTPDEITANAKQMSSIFMPMMLAITTIIYLFLGALLSVVVSGMIIQLKKYGNRPDNHYPSSK